MKKCANALLFNITYDDWRTAKAIDKEAFTAVAYELMCAANRLR